MTNDHREPFEDPIPVVDRTGTAADEPTPVAHGMDRLSEALAGRGGSLDRLDHWTETDADPVLVVGPAGDPVVRKLLGEAITTPEAVAYRWAGTDRGTALVAAGSDDRGLMYALVELADRVEARGIGALDRVEDTVETPDNEVRGVDRFVANPEHDDWLFAEDFWHYYLGRLARNRFNRFTLVVGYDTAYLSPPYPFVVDVDGFPDVRVAEALDVGRDEHRSQLRRIGKLCHRYGLEFVFATWQQRPRSANPDVASDTEQGLLVEGLPDDAEGYTAYCAAGLRELLVACPEIDGIQLRVNYESGVGDRGTAEEFWRELIDAVAAASEERGRDVGLDLRAKGLTDNMIRWAEETGLDVTVPTKFWCEGTGLPYHNSRMRERELDGLDDMNLARRYSYSDLLEKPRFYDVLYRLWVYGTNRLFVWGDPDYARRFSHATGFGGAVGFEVTAPLTMKGGRYFLREDWPLFDDPELRDYEWEDERYWAWYLFFGRLGYSRETDPGVWEREFESRFGEAAAAVAEAYRAASKVLPLITAAHLTRHSANANWAEMDTGGALFADHNVNDRFEDVTYLTAEPGDPGLFYGVDEYVEDDLADDLRGKYTPPQVAGWYRRLASRTRGALGRVGDDAPDTGEYRATRLDLLVLCDLAEYHANKTDAAVGLARYRRTDDPAAVEEAHEAAVAARSAWESLVERTRGTYHADVVFGRDRATADRGTWADGLAELDADVEELDRLLSAVDDPGTEGESDPGRSGDAAAGPADLPSLAMEVPDRCPPGEDLDVVIRTGELSGFDELFLRYRHTDLTEGPFRTARMEPTDGGYRATIPGDYVVEEWDLLIYLSTVDDAGNGILYPGIYHADEPLPYAVVEVDDD